MSISSITPRPVGGLALEQAGTTIAASEGGVDFAALLQETLRAQQTEQVIAMSGQSDPTASLSGMESMGGGGIEGLMLAAAASGETSDAQTALFMLLMMMQSEAGQSTDMGGLMSLMTTVVEQLDSGQQTTVYRSAMDSAFDREDLLTVEEQLFSGLPATRDVQRTGAQAVVPTSAWKAATPAITGDAHSRSPEALREIIDQFEVTSSERYRPFRNGVTYCNIFLWDVTSALGCEIPHYIDNVTGQGRSYPDVSGAWEMNANATSDWLAAKGGQNGWREVSAEQAQAWANQGRPAVTAWKNTADKPGHVQIVCPSEDGGFDPIRGVTVAQAGAKVTGYTHISSTFKQSDLKNVKYYIHE